MLIRPVPSCGHTWPTLSPGKSSLQPVGPSSCTRHGWFRIAPIDQYSLLLPPVGVWTVSQFQCGGPVLSEPLPIVGLVGRHPANCLMGRVPILHRVAPLAALGCPCAASWNISASFPAFCSCAGQVAHVLRTRTPLVIAVLLRHVTVRLACIKPAASVHPEPGSNSPLYVILSFSFVCSGLLQIALKSISSGCLLLISICSKNFPAARLYAPPFGIAKVELFTTRIAH